MGQRSHSGRDKQSGGRVTPKGGGAIARLSASERAGLERIFSSTLRSATKDLSDDLPPLAVEVWASQMWSVWDGCELIGLDARDVLCGGMLTYAARKATPAALLVLRALASVLPDPYGARAGREADRLAAAGVDGGRRWLDVVGTGAPTSAWIEYDPVDDDGASVLVGFDGPGEPSTVGLYIDHNLGGIAKDALVLPEGIDELLPVLAEGDGVGFVPALREIPLAEAAARWRAALEMTDMTLDPPTSEDLRLWRALVESRLARLPDGGSVPGAPELDDDAREQLLGEFLASEEAVGLRAGSTDGEPAGSLPHLVRQVMTFALDYNLGTPLRFSPVMVEIFCMDFAPRKIPADAAAFALLAQVLTAWIRFVGRRRAIPAEAITAAVAAVGEYAPEMIELAGEPENWGPAKTMLLAMRRRGIDVGDQEAVDAFVAEVNRNGGIDVLADSMAAAR